MGGSPEKHLGTPQEALAEPMWPDCDPSKSSH